MRSRRLYRNIGHRSSTRALDVGVTDEQTALIRLIDSSGLEDVYVALRHYWGHSKTLKIIKAIVNSRMECTQISELQLTFYEIVLLVRWLRIRYHCIDTLYII